jgi:hypothetical protein
MLQLDAQQSGAPMYSHQSVMTYTNDGRGQPKVYQASTSTTNAGNGVSHFANPSKLPTWIAQAVEQ